MKTEEARKTCCIVILMICFACLVRSPCQAGIQNDSQDLHIEVTDGKISLNINNKPLVDILLAIQARTGVDIRMVGMIGGRVSIKLSDLSLGQALNRLLRQVGYAALWEEKDDNSTLRKVWIYGRGEGIKIDKLRTNVSEDFSHEVYTKSTRNQNQKELIDTGTRNANRDIQPRVRPYFDSSRSVKNNSSSDHMAGNNNAESNKDSEDSLINNANNSTIAVTVENGKDVGAYEFHITYDPKLVQIENITPGSYLSDTGRNVSVLKPRIDNKKGEASFGVFSFGSGEGANGEGVLAKITCSGSSMASLKLSKVQITDTKANTLSLIPKIQ